MIVPLSLCFITASETMDILSGVDRKRIINCRKARGNDKETIKYLEEEIQSILSKKNWPQKMKKFR